jgi:predicted AAA+ superfamily ATPase
MNFNSLIPKNYIEREIEKRILSFINDKEVIALCGPRQSGKSTLLKKIGLFLQEKYGQDNVFFVDFEDEIEKLKFETDPKEYLKFYLRKKNKVFILLDEIQYVKESGKILKLLYDHYPQLKLIVSGSSSLDVGKIGQFLVGRVVFFELYPFSFLEFLQAKDKNLYLEYQEKRFFMEKPKKVDSLFKDKLRKLLEEYLTYGGYPRIVLEKDEQKKIFLLKNLFSAYVEKDIVKLYGVKYKEKAIILLKYLAEKVGGLLNFNELCQLTNLHFHEVKELISIFEQTYVIKRISPFYKNLVTELKKNPKVYFFDLGFRNLLVDRFNFSDDEWGKILENYGFLLYKEKSLNFWRTTAKAEVDFVLKEKNDLIPIEIKKTAKISRSLLSFINVYHPKIVLIFNLDKSDSFSRNNTKIFFIPIFLG